MKKIEGQLARPKPEQQQKTVSRAEANKRLDLFQKYIGSALIASASFGVYLLATDKSLWLLAVSHAYGLIAICAIDIVLGSANLLSSARKVILPSYGWAILTVVLQLGDIVTAPQYKMTPEYFASYLFHLWAYDGLLLMQGAVIAIGLSARRYQKIVVRKKHLTYFDMGFKKSRRDFLQITGAIGVLIAITAALSALAALSTPSPSLPSSNGGSSSGQNPNLPSGAVANMKDIQVNVPMYFDYPSSGYPNMLLKKADGSLSALSILCTHLCCQCQYDSSSTDIFCPCHGSVFDQNGNVLRGPATINLPSIQLSIDNNGNIFPVKVVGSSPCGLG